MGGGLVKGHGHSNGSRRRSYGLVLIVALAAAVLGGMVIHKLRERRIFNLLIKEKDRELFSVHLLLQKERDEAKEAKRKNAEMRGKMHSLRAQKLQLESIIFKMQSTISSLREEQRLIGLSLEEKQNEIKLLTERDINASKEDPQAANLNKFSRQNEAENGELKHRVDLPVKIWSVSSDDPSNPPVNLTAKVTVSQREKSDAHESREARLAEIAQRGQITGEAESKKLENAQLQGSGRETAIGEQSTDEIQSKSVENSQHREDPRLEEEADSTTEILNDGDGDHKEKVVDAKKLETNESNQLGKFPNSRQSEYHQLHGLKDGLKLEVQGNAAKATSNKIRHSHASIERANRKGLKISADNGNFENRGVEVMRRRRFSKGTVQSEGNKKLRDEEEELQKLDTVNHKIVPNTEEGMASHENGKVETYEQNQQDATSLAFDDTKYSSLKHRRREAALNAGTARNEKGKGHVSTLENQESVASVDVKLLNPEKSEYAEDMSISIGKLGINQVAEKGQKMEYKYEAPAEPNHPSGEVAGNTTVHKVGSGTFGGAILQRPDEVGQSEVIKEHVERRDLDESDDDSEQVKDAEKYEAEELGG